jgi:hypothetical protein
VQVPDWFPVDADAVVLVSGLAEVALGAPFVTAQAPGTVGALLAASTS